MHLLKNAYEQNLAQCIGRPQSAWFLFIFLIPDPLNSLIGRISTMDQGSVVVLCRQGFFWRQILSQLVRARDLNYSGLIPTATTLIPDPMRWSKTATR